MENVDQVMSMWTAALFSFLLVYMVMVAHKDIRNTSEHACPSPTRALPRPFRRNRRDARLYATCSGMHEGWHPDFGFPVYWMYLEA